MSANCWAFDVDGTLIGSIRSDLLRPGADELLAALAERQVRTVLWSAGGADYAAQMAGRHGLTDRFEGFYGKLARDAWGRYLVDHFAAAHRPSVFVDDAPEDMPAGATVIGVAPFLGGNPADRVLLDLVDRLDHLLAAPGTHG